MNEAVAIFQGPVGWLILLMAFFGIGLAIVKIPKAKTLRSTIAVLSVVGILFTVGIGYGAPLFMADDKDVFTESYEVQMTEDNTAASWADYLGTTDADLWAAAEGDCNNALHQCVVLCAATRVGGGANTLVPDEALIAFKVTRNSDNPNVDYEDDVVYPTVRFSYAHATWTNSTDGSTYDAIYKDANSNYIVYIEQGVTAGGEGLVSGETKKLDGMYPGDSLTYYIGFKLNTVGFGADGQTANVSSLTLTGEIAGYSFTVDLNVISIA